MGIIIDGTLEGFRSRRDKTVAVTIGLNELDTNRFTQLAEMNQEYVKVYISKESIDKETQTMLDDLQLDEDEKRTPSQRLRAVIYRIWEPAHKAKKTKKVFTEFYRDFMEKIIQDLKEKHFDSEHK
jgi:hypothetical protein